MPGLVGGFVGPLTRGLVARLQAMGEPAPGALTVGMVGARSAVHPTGAAEPLTAGGCLSYRFLSVPATEPLPAIAARLNVAVTCTSETLTPELRAAIRAGFGAPMWTRTRRPRA